MRPSALEAGHQVGAAARTSDGDSSSKGSRRPRVGRDVDTCGPTSNRISTIEASQELPCRRIKTSSVSSVSSTSLSAASVGTMSSMQSLSGAHKTSCMLSGCSGRKTSGPPPKLESNVGTKHSQDQWTPNGTARGTKNRCPTGSLSKVVGSSPPQPGVVVLPAGGEAPPPPPSSSSRLRGVSPRKSFATQRQLRRPTGQDAAEAQQPADDTVRTSMSAQSSRNSLEPLASIATPQAGFFHSRNSEDLVSTCLPSTASTVRRLSELKQQLEDSLRRAEEGLGLEQHRGVDARV